jgi:hypothetical protein
MSAELITTKQFVNTNLKAYYRFESGALTTDSSGEGHTLTAIGTPGENSSGKFGGAVHLGNEDAGTDTSQGDDSGSFTYATNYWRASQFTPTKACLFAIEVSLKKTGSPTGNLTVEIQSDNAEAPSGTVLATTTLDVATLTTSLAQIKIPINVVLTPSTRYWICLKGQSAWGTTNNVTQGMTTGLTGQPKVYYGAGSFSGSNTADSWNQKTYYSLSSISSAYSATDHADFKPTGVFSVGAWFKTSETGAGNYIFVSTSQNTAVAGIRLGKTSGNVAFILSGRNTGTTLGTNYQQALGTTTITDSAWHFVVGTWDGSYLRIYVDGVDDNTPVSWANAPAYAATNYVRVGCSNATGTNRDFFTGSLDDVFLLNGTALSADQIKGIYDGKTNFKLNIGDDWKDADYAYINIGDAWKPVTEAKINIGDTWKSIF